MRTAARSAALLSTVWLVIEMIRGGIPWTPFLFVALSVLWNFHAKDPDLHPAAYIFTSQGGLEGLPWPLRWAIGIAILGAFAALAKTLEKRLAPVRLGAPR